MPFPYSENSVAAPASTPPRVDAVLFDYGMVLSGPPAPSAWDKMRAITGLDGNVLHAAYWRFRHDYDRAALGGHAYWLAVASDAGITLTGEQIAALAAADIDLWTTPNPPMVEWAQRLQHASVRTGILSNIGDWIGEGVVAKLPWLAQFNVCIWSHTLFMAKPDPQIYLKTAEALHTAPVNILFLDDKQENVEAAAALGFQAIQYSGQPAFEHEMRARGFAFLLDVGSNGQIASAAVQSQTA